jgi:hypothetical protein
MRTQFWIKCLKGTGRKEKTHRQENNIKVDLREMGLECVD